MSEKLSQIASDPLQYDGPKVMWAAEGTMQNPNRQLFLYYLEHLLSQVKDKHVLDVGSGQGWLLHALGEHGAHARGLEPSRKNVQASRKFFPAIPVTHASLQDFITDEHFDYIFAIMVLEHFLDLTAALRKVKQLLAPSGSFVTIVGDYDKFVGSSMDFDMQREELAPGETAVSIDYGKDRHGVLCDIHRTIERHVRCAEAAGLKLRRHTPMPPNEAHHRYATHRDKPIFHMLEYTA